MATKIKLNGTWVDVAGTTKWIGTKAELTAALAAGQIPDGTEVIVTDDYADGTIVTAQVTNMLTIPMSHTIVERCGNIVKATLRWYKDPLDTAVHLNMQTPVCTIPEGFRPVDDGRSLPLGIQWNTTNSIPVQFFMQGDGVMKNGNEVDLTGRADMYCEAVWMTNDAWPA